MRKTLRNLLWACIALCGLELLPACAGTVYVRPAPPPVVVEVRPARPHKSAVWVDGHWSWAGHRRGYVWVPGHWVVVHHKRHR